VFYGVKLPGLFVKIKGFSKNIRLSFCMLCCSGYGEGLSSLVWLALSWETQALISQFTILRYCTMVSYGEPPT